MTLEHEVPRSWIRITSLSTLVVLASLLLPIANGQTQAGSFEYAQPGGFGSLSTIYVLSYEMPSIFRTNSTEQLRVWMNVTQFSQTASKIEALSLKVTLTLSNREYVRTGGSPQWLERGKSWGPFTFEFLITDVEIGLGPSEAVDATLKITANVVEYWYPPIGNPMPYPIAFSNQEQILTRVINPAKKPVLSLTEVLQSLVQQLGVSFFERLVKLVLGGGAISLAIRFVMPRQFLPLLLALGGVFVLVGVLLLVPELTAFGAVLIGAAIVLYVLAHRDELT